MIVCKKSGAAHRSDTASNLRCGAEPGVVADWGVIWDLAEQDQHGGLMKEMGLSAQRRLWRVLEHDAEAVERCNGEKYPKSKALSKAEQSSIWFADEAGGRSDFHRGTTWAPVGVGLVVGTTGARCCCNIISAVSASDDMRLMLATRSAAARVLVEFLRRLITGSKRLLFLVVECRHSCRSWIVRQFLRRKERRIRLFYLEFCSPRFNPEEQVWRGGKLHAGCRKAVGQQVRTEAVAAGDLRKLQRARQGIRAFIRAPQTAYALARQICLLPEL